MSITIARPEVTAETYDISGYSYQVMLISNREARGRSWVTCITARVPSRSGGEEHHVRIYRKNPSKCSCLAGQNNRLCWAVKQVALIADDCEFWKK